MDRKKAWDAEEAAEKYSTHVRPKTHSLYNDAMADTDNQSNLYPLMSMLITQTLSDLYTVWVDMDPANNAQYTKVTFLTSYLHSMLQAYNEEEQAGPRIIN